MPDARNVAVIGAAGVCVTFYWWLRVLGAPASDPPPFWDIGVQIYPMWLRAGALMRSGELPLWNPHQALGHPFAASVLYGVFYPFNLIRVFVSAEWALEVTAILHLWLAWTFMFLFLRVGLELRGSSAAVGATAYGLGGFVILESVWFTAAGQAAAWVPAVFLALEGVLRDSGTRRARRWWAALLSVAVAMPILAGWLQTWLHTMHVLSLYAVVCIISLRAGKLGAVRWLLAALILGILLAGVQLLPSIELQQMGWRNPGGLSLAQQLVMPLPTGAKVLSAAVDPTPGLPRPAYVGLVTLAVIPLALFARAQRMRVIALGAVLLWSVAVATGLEPFFSLYRELPGGRLFRVPSRMLGFFAFAASALGAIGCDWLVARADRRSAFLGATVGTIVLVVLGIDLFRASYSTIPRPIQRLEAFNELDEVFRVISGSAGLDRYYVHNVLLSFAPLTPKQATIRELYAVGDYEVLSLDRLNRYCTAMAGRDTMAPAAFVGVCLASGSPQSIELLSRLGVRFVVAHRANREILPNLERAGWRAIFKGDDGYLVYENPRPLPRSFIAYDRQLADEQGALDATIAADPWRTVVVESAPPARSARRIESAEILDYGANRVRIRARASEDGTLVLTDTFYPGWRAYVDGTPTPISRANFLFRGVPIDAGEHLVEFRFEPTSVRVGAGLSVLASCILLVMLCLPESWTNRPRMT